MYVSIGAQVSVRRRCFSGSDFWNGGLREVLFAGVGLSSLSCERGRRNICEE